MTTPDADTYALRTTEVAEVSAPKLDYLPPMPRNYCPRIGVIGAGGIASAHLDAYKTAGWEIAAICNRTMAKAETLAQTYAPDALVTANYETVLADASIDVVDITLHPTERLPIIEAALKARKHVLSQKPFVLDLSEGARLVALARDKGLKLSVNQNGRWAPHLSWMRAAVRAGLLGDIVAAHTAIHWSHDWIATTPFDRIEDVILYDFGIHWFDFIASIVPNPESVFATSRRASGQKSTAPLMAQVLARIPGGQASLIFDGGLPHGANDTTYIGGTKGSLQSVGPDLGTQTVTLVTAEGRAQPTLQGTWFNDGFRGAMGALLVAIEEDAEPLNGAAENLRSLAFAFAAIQSRRSGREIAVGSVTKLDL